MYMYRYVHAYIYTYMYIYIYTYKYMHMYTYVLLEYKRWDRHIIYNIYNMILSNKHDYTQKVPLSNKHDNCSDPMSRSQIL